MIGRQNSGLILCVGGPCAGQRVIDSGHRLQRVQVPRDFRWQDGEAIGLVPPSWAAYRRVELDFGDGWQIRVLLPDGRGT